VVATDSHPSLLKSVAKCFPFSEHILCLHHLDTDIKGNLRGPLGDKWLEFRCVFYECYYAVSPAQFQLRWDAMIRQFPAADKYLNGTLWPRRHQWAWAWVSSKFTAGIRTSGRCESENKDNKRRLTGTMTMLQVFEELNARTKEQSEKALV